jgi:hypothetical protein
MSKTNTGIPRVLRVFPPATKNILVFNSNALSYMFYFADIIQLNIKGKHCLAKCDSCQPFKNKMIQRVEFFLSAIPPTYQSGRLHVFVSGELDDFLMSLKKYSRLISPQVLSLSDGIVHFSKRKYHAFTVLYGCEKVVLKHVEFVTTGSNMVY